MGGEIMVKKENKNSVVTKNDYSLLDDIRRMQKEMDTLINRFFNDDRFLFFTPQELTQLNTSFRTPLTEIKDEKDKIVARLEIPGVNKDDIKVNALDRGIEIKAETENKKEEKQKGEYKFESRYSGFYKYFELPNNVDKDKISANYKDGILTLEIPKTKQLTKPVKQIPVKS
jgi:HSP20 family protein